MPFRSVGCLFLVCLIGCGKKQLERVPLQPVTGKVLVDGRGVANVEISLRPVSVDKDKPEHKIAPSAKTDANGTFKISTYGSEDGAPTGEYVILASWPRIKIEGGEESFGPDRFANAYNNPSQPAGKVTVKEGDNVIPPLKLKASAP
jgi:hypothetical protein